MTRASTASLDRRASEEEGGRRKAARRRGRHCGKECGGEEEREDGDRGNGRDGADFVSGARERGGGGVWREE